MERPLTGLVVLDATRLLPGAYATALLAHLGAEVRRLTTPGAEDPLAVIERQLGGDGRLTRALAAGVTEIATDLEGPGGRRTLETELDGADVLCESLSPRAAERLGLARRTLRARWPELVHLKLTATGEAGALAARGGHDLSLLAMSGALAALAEPGQAPAVPGIQVAGIGAGAHPAVQAILAALVGRQRTGRGDSITVSMVHALEGWLGLERTTRGRPVPRGGLPCYAVYAAQDGAPLAVGALHPALWAKFCAFFERDDWRGRQLDPTLVPEVAARLAERSRAEWIALRAETGVPVEAVLDVAEGRQFIRGAGQPASGAEWLPGAWFLSGEADGARHPLST